MSNQPTQEGAVPVPEPPSLDPDDPRTKRRDRVQDALLALPGYFNSTTNIEGLAATDLFSLNTVLGAAIEEQVVQMPNRIRDGWDPNGMGDLLGDGIADCLGTVAGLS